MRVVDLRYVMSYWVQIVSLPDMTCTVSPLTAGSHEVMVQGKQTSAVLELLGSLGVPEKWIEVSNIVGRKKK